MTPLDRLDALATAHARLCACLDRLRLAAWIAQGRPHGSGPQAFSRWLLTVPTRTMQQVDAKIAQLDRRLNDLDEAYASEQTEQRA